MSRRVRVTIPKRVWDDYLDPNTTQMQAELGLPEPRFKHVGRGGQMVYEKVEPDVIEELAWYIRDRAEGLLSGGGADGDEGVHRVALAVAARLLGPDW